MNRTGVVFLVIILGFHATNAHSVTDSTSHNIGIIIRPFVKFAFQENSEITLTVAVNGDDQTFAHARKEITCSSVAASNCRQTVSVHMETDARAPSNVRLKLTHSGSPGNGHPRRSETLLSHHSQDFISDFRNTVKENTIGVDYFLEAPEDSKIFQKHGESSFQIVFTVTDQ